MAVKSAKKEREKPKGITRYGAVFPSYEYFYGPIPSGIPQDIYQRRYDAAIEYQMLIPGKKPPGHMGYEYHFKEYISAIWGRQDWDHRFIWTPLADRMLKESANWKFLGIAGHASSGKSRFGVVYGLAKFFLDPANTKVFITSTTLSDSRQRIWGDVERYWHEAIRLFGGESFLPGKLVSSRGIIRSTVGGAPSDLAGLALIAGDKSQEKDSTTKIGFKAKNVILIGDELPMLSEGLYKAAKGNLFSNPNFQMIGIGNPDSYFDAFGSFVEPENGWGTISEEMDGWRTKLGYCIRFDGLKSPNVLAGKEIYPGLLTLEKVNFYKQNLGERSGDFYRMCRGYFSPAGQTPSVYTPQEIYSYKANMSMLALSEQKLMTWESVPTTVLSLDPAYTYGGDRAVITIGKIGMAIDLLTGNRFKVLEITESINLHEDITDKVDVSEQVVRMVREAMAKYGVLPQNVAVDGSGAHSFKSLLARDIGAQFLTVQFGGSPSETPISRMDQRKAKDRFSNKVTELWYVGKELIRSGQLKGLTTDLIKEMCARTYENLGDKVKVEKKEDMKSRTMRSPDLYDSACVMIELCRQKHGLSSAEKSAKPILPKTPVHSYFTKKPEPLWETGPSLRNDGLTWGN